MSGGKVDHEAGWVRLGGGGIGGKRNGGNGEISNQVQNYDGDSCEKREQSNRFSEQNKIFFIRESERLGYKFYRTVEPR